MAGTVLVAEDYIGLRTVYGRFLENKGFQVLTAANQDELLARAAAADALVVDARLPSREYEGILAVGQLQKNGTLRPETPVIFISFDPEQHDSCQQKLRAAGIERSRYVWLQKPFELHLLIKRLNEELQKRRP